MPAREGCTLRDSFQMTFWESQNPGLPGTETWGVNGCKETWNFWRVLTVSCITVVMVVT